MEKYRILLVEDEAQLNQLIQMNLEMENYTVVSCNNGITALQIAQEQAFDLIISDIMLPGMDGLTFCESIRIQGNKTPLMFISAKSSSKERIEGLKVGANDYLPKPFDLEELLLRTKNLIAQKESGVKPLAESSEYAFQSGTIKLMLLKSSIAMEKRIVCPKRKSCYLNCSSQERVKPSAERKSWTRFGVMTSSLPPEPLIISSPTSENISRPIANTLNIFTA